MQEIRFTVDGEPIALKRHRTSKGRTYDPSSSDKDDFLMLSKLHKPKTPLQIPLRVVLLFGFSRPKSHFGTGKNSGKVKANAVNLWQRLTMPLSMPTRRVVKSICKASLTQH
jgi:hypothetical protein